MEPGGEAGGEAGTSVISNVFLELKLGCWIHR